MKAIALVVVIFLAVSPAFAAEQGFMFKSNPAIAEVKPKKPVKVKLKRSEDGRYSWELNGDDAEEVMKADRQIRRLLKDSAPPEPRPKNGPQESR